MTPSGLGTTLGLSNLQDEEVGLHEKCSWVTRASPLLAKWDEATCASRHARRAVAPPVCSPRLRCVERMAQANVFAPSV